MITTLLIRTLHKLNEKNLITFLPLLCRLNSSGSVHQGVCFRVFSYLHSSSELWVSPFTLNSWVSPLFRNNYSSEQKFRPSVKYLGDLIGDFQCEEVHEPFLVKIKMTGARTRFQRGPLGTQCICKIFFTCFNRISLWYTYISLESLWMWLCAFLLWNYF